MVNLPTWTAHVEAAEWPAALPRARLGLRLEPDAAAAAAFTLTKVTPRAAAHCKILRSGTRRSCPTSARCKILPLEKSPQLPALPRPARPALPSSPLSPSSPFARSLGVSGSRACPALPCVALPRLAVSDQEHARCDASSVAATTAPMMLAVVVRLPAAPLGCCCATLPRGIPSDPHAPPCCGPAAGAAAAGGGAAAAAGGAA